MTHDATDARRAILRRVESDLGVVPEFLKRIPDPHLVPMWAAIRDLELSPGRIPAMYQQLVMLGVAIHARCRYSTFFHTEAARALGVTDDELMETTLLVGHTASWSSVLTGMGYDPALFEREVRAICRTLSGASSKPSRGLSRGVGIGG